MEEIEIKIEDILGVFKNTKDGKRTKNIKEEVFASLISDNTDIFEMELKRDEIYAQVERLLKEDQKQGKESFLSYNKGVYKRKPKKIVVNAGADIDTIFKGAAGETAVISELLFHGFNANRMMVDEGIDIVAAKDNVYRYIQVKTTSIKDGKIQVQISKDRFDTYIQNQLRYVIVARCKKDNHNMNMFFIFSDRDIDKGIHDGYIKLGESSISIKVRFKEQSGTPFLYDVKESDASYHMNNFELI